MSNDNPNSQPRRNRRRPTRPSDRQSSNRQSSTRQPSNQNQPPFWKTAIIQLLRGTIGILENTVEQLETEPIEGSGNQGGLGRFLPTPVVGAILIGVTAAIAWFGSNYFNQNSSQVAVNPTTQPTPVVISEEAAKPEISETLVPDGNINPEITKPEVIKTPVPQLEAKIPEKLDTPNIENGINPEEINPEEAKPDIKNEDIPTEETTPETEAVVTEKPQQQEYIPLTPEQNLIASIQNRLEEVSDRIVSGIVKSVQANFRNSTLAVKISDEWYTLKPSQQNQIANDIWERSQELDFTHLEIFDTQDNLVARNPVVGNQVVILQRVSSSQILGRT